MNPKADLRETFMAASISFDASMAAAFAAATTVATVPDAVFVLPAKEFTASLWARNTSCVALVIKQDFKFHSSLNYCLLNLIHLPNHIKFFHYLPIFNSNIY